MREILELIEYLESLGHEIVQDGEYLRVKQGQQIPIHLKEQLRQDKLWIIQTLKRDQTAKENQFVIGLPGTLYFKSIGRRSVIYIEEINDNWTAWRETDYAGAKRSVSSKSICTAKTFDYVMLQVEKYCDFIIHKNK